jgi:tyrosine-protein phosphatase YwqE
LINWFKKKSIPSVQLTTDVHSHLLPGLDDGVKTLEETEAILRIFQGLGYTKVITTPHIMQDHYRNTPTIITDALQKVREFIQEKNIEITIDAAAEYYLDEYFVKQIENDEQLLTFGDNYLLFETNFLSEPLNINEFIFLATTKGYKPILAHPERYVYLQNNQQRLADLIDRGVLFQLNVSSILGVYSKPIQSLANKLIDLGFAHLLGSDCHNMQHASFLKDVQKVRHFKKALTLPLLNNTL